LLCHAAVLVQVEESRQALTCLIKLSLAKIGKRPIEADTGIVRGEGLRTLQDINGGIEGLLAIMRNPQSRERAYVLRIFN